MLKVIGRITKALLWYFFSLIISLIIVRMTPILPLRTPPRHLKATAMGKLWEKPNPMILSIVPSKPMYRTRFLPPYSASAIRPHSIAVRNWAAGNAALMTPAWYEIVESGSDGSKDWSW
jgi:hypothetical protein